MVNIKINGIPLQVEEETTVLDAARKVNIKIPTLCYNPDLPAWASCGLCIVRTAGAGSPRMARACSTPVAENMDIITHDPELIATRRVVLELIMSNHPADCLQCPRNGNCELQTLAAELASGSCPLSIFPTGFQLTIPTRQLC